MDAVDRFGTVTEFSSGIFLVSADGNDSVRERNEHLFQEEIKPVQRGFHLKGKTVRSVDDSGFAPACGEAPEESGFRTVKVNDVRLEVADQTSEMDDCRQIGHGGRSAFHVYFRAGYVFFMEEVDVSEKILFTACGVCDMDSPAACREPECQIAKMAPRTADCRFEYKQHTLF